MPGKIVQARAQVRMTVRWLDVFAASTFFSSFSSMYGPFFDDLDTLFSCSACYPRWPLRINRVLAALHGAAANDHLVGPLVIARPLKGRLTPLRLRLSADRRFTLATTVRMIARVHDRAAHGRAPTHVTTATGLADHDVLMIDIADLTQRGHARQKHQPHLAGRHPDLGVLADLGHQLGRRAGGAAHLAALAWRQLNVMDLRAGGDVLQRQGIPGPD